ISSSSSVATLKVKLIIPVSGNSKAGLINKLSGVKASKYQDQESANQPSKVSISSATASANSQLSPSPSLSTKVQSERVDSSLKTTVCACKATPKVNALPKSKFFIILIF